MRGGLGTGDRRRRRRIRRLRSDGRSGRRGQGIFRGAAHAATPRPRWGSATFRPGHATCSRAAVLREQRRIAPSCVTSTSPSVEQRRDTARVSVNYVLDFADGPQQINDTVAVDRAQRLVAPGRVGGVGAAAVRPGARPRARSSARPLRRPGAACSRAPSRSDSTPRICNSTRAPRRPAERVRAGRPHGRRDHRRAGRRGTAALNAMLPAVPGRRADRRSDAARARPRRRAGQPARHDRRQSIRHAIVGGQRIAPGADRCDARRSKVQRLLPVAGLQRRRRDQSRNGFSAGARHARYATPPMQLAWTDDAP